MLRRVARWLGRALALALVLGGLLLADMWSAFGEAPEGTRKERVERSPRYRDGKFHNDLPRHDRPGQAAWKFLTESARREPKAPLPIESRTRADYDTPPQSGLRITWLGHSTMLVEIDGGRVLFDPVWGERASPSRFMGPKRFHRPPLPFEELPQVDAVVISHDHYDHLDESTMKKLASVDTTFVCPLAVGAHLESWGVPAERIVELDWWERHTVKGLHLVATPARHFSGRGVFDHFTTLWAGWAIVGPEHRVFFSGDSAMFPGFAEIGERLGPFDATMLETGAYNQAWADVHMGPEQAVQAHRMLRGKLMLPVHWGTFNLALHGWTEPIERVLVAAERAGVSVVTPRPGGWFEPSTPPTVARWWPEIPWKTAEESPVVSSGLEETISALGNEAFDEG